jgi:hypothetical protein
MYISVLSLCGKDVEKYALKCGKRCYKSLCVLINLLLISLCAYKPSRVLFNPSETL